ncbi:MAG: hypothetical protein ACOY3K_02690 [Candidatus Omnitrophota bacterium]
MNFNQPSKQDQALRRLVRNYLAEEIRDPEIARAKKTFIREQFGAPPLWGGWLPAFRPVAVFGICLALIFASQFALDHAGNFDLEPLMRWTSNFNPPRESPQDLAGIGNPVEVKRLSGFAGPTMMFQKAYGNMTMTVIWVFTNGEKI